MATALGLLQDLAKVVPMKRSVATGTLTHFGLRGRFAALCSYKVLLYAATMRSSPVRTGKILSAFSDASEE